MEIEFLNENNRQEWDDFALNSGSAWFRHTTDWLKYSSCCRFDSDTKNHSFMVKQNREIIAIVPLLSEYDYDNKENTMFAMYGDYTPIPAFKDNCDVNKKSITDFINEKINNIAQENNIHYGKFMIDPLTDANYFRDFQLYNLMDYGARLNFSTTNVVDLTLDEDVIIRLMRKGHKAAIKQVLKDDKHKVEIYDRNNITKEKLLKFKEIHKTDAGRQTRTDESWECMYNWILSGKAFLTLLWLDDINDYAAGALIMTYKKSAYYASYATTSSDILNGHHGYRIQWEVIKYLKRNGYELYETGINYYKNSIWGYSDKHDEISKYQRGYRSIEVPMITYSLKYGRNNE